MYVVKRDGRQEKVHFDKITSRLSRLCWGLNSDYVDPVEVSQKVCMGVYKGVTTSELDELAAETAAQFTCLHPDFGLLAARIAVSNLHKSTLKSFSDTCSLLYNYVEPRTGLTAPMLSDDVYRFIQENAEALNSNIVYDRDFMYDYFGFKTLQHGYLLKINGKVVERPQHMLMRVSCGIHTRPKNDKTGEPATFDLQAAIQTYDLMSQKWFTHATPTLFNSGTRCAQLSSCFLLSMFDDSIEGIYDTLKSCAMISKQAGGIGVSVSNIRAAGSYIRGTNGTSNGLIPMLRVFNNTARYVDQCFTPETTVWTVSGPKTIGECNVTDKLLNADGSFTAIDSLLRHPFDGKVLNVRIGSGSSVRVTEEHQIMAAQCEGRQMNGESLLNRIAKGYTQPQMVDARDLVVGDYVVFPMPSSAHAVDVASLSITDCTFYGLLVSFGTIGEDLSSVKFDIANVDASAFVTAYCSERGIPIREVVDEAASTVTFEWVTASVGFKFHENQIVSKDGKRVIEAQLSNLPLPKVKAVLRGFVGLTTSPFDFDVNSASASATLQWMLMRCGHFPQSNGTRVTIPSHTEIAKCDSIPSCAESIVNGVYSSGRFFVPVTSLVFEHYKGKVFDFELSSDSDHTYCTAMGVCHNGGGKRKGAFAVYLEPWHADIFAFLDLKKNHGSEEQRARDLFYGLWIPDLFMKRVESDGEWALMCPHEAPGLYSTWGDEFESLYTKYEKIPGKPRKVIKARQLWAAILDSQTETGTPYMLYKDAANRKSNQKNLGTIRCSNLCTEIVEFTSPDEIAVCNLSSLALPMFVTKERAFDFQKLFDVTQVATRNLNKVIDINYYPVKQAENSNLRNRPIGLGVQGLADAFILMRYPFDSKEAVKLNSEIFETIYFAALSASMDLAKIHGPYASIKGSPIDNGQFQFDMWGVDASKLSGRWDWEGLRAEIKKHGVRNSLLVAPMPTASTSQILGNNEAFEPYTQNIYLRRTLAGEFVCVSRHLLKDLIELGIWNHDLKMKLIAHNGSVQNIEEIPKHIKELYKTVWEISQKTIIEMAADRGIFIDQSQSLNIHMQNVNVGKLTSMHFYAWKKGLKTGMYYLRTKPATDAIKFTVDPQLMKQEMQQKAAMDEINDKLKNKKAPPPSPQSQTVLVFEEKDKTPSPSPSPSPLPFQRQTSTADGEDLESVTQIQQMSNLSGSLGPLEAEKEKLKLKDKGLETGSGKENTDPNENSEGPALDEWRAARDKAQEMIECSLDNPDACLSCGS